jgi:hypothetical protein
MLALKVPLLVGFTHPNVRPQHFAAASHSCHRAAISLTLDELSPLNSSLPLNPPPPPTLEALSGVFARQLNLTPSWGQVGIGCVLFVLLHSFALSAASLAGASPASDSGGFAAVTCRLLATGTFAAVQAQVGVPVDAWLTPKPALAQRREGDRWWLLDRPNEPPPAFLSSPLAPPAAAATFILVTGALCTAIGVEWLPAARALPDAGRLCEYVQHAMDISRTHESFSSSAVSSSSSFLAHPPWLSLKLTM